MKGGPKDPLPSENLQGVVLKGPQSKVPMHRCLEEQPRHEQLLNSDIWETMLIRQKLFKL